MSEKKLTKKDVNGAFFRWWLMQHLTYNYQRMQGGAFASVLGPILKKLYPDNKEELIEGLKRHLIFFNTEHRCGAMIPGMTVALEEKRAEEPGTVDAQTIIDLKSSLMGPFAGIGDTVTQALVKPILLSIFLGWCTEGKVWAAIAFALTFLVYDFCLTRFTFMTGYNLGIDSVDKFMDNAFVKRLTTGLGILGLFVLGAMVCKFVTVDAVLEIPVSTGDPINVGVVLGKIMPKIIPLGITVYAWKMIQKGKSTSLVLITLFAFSFILGALGVLG